MPWSLPHLPPLTAFFSWGRNILLQISGGAYAPPVLKQGGHMHTVPHGCARLCLESFVIQAIEFRIRPIFPQQIRIQTQRIRLPPSGSRSRRICINGKFKDKILTLLSYSKQKGQPFSNINNTYIFWNGIKSYIMLRICYSSYIQQ